MFLLLLNNSSWVHCHKCICFNGAISPHIELGKNLGYIMISAKIKLQNVLLYNLYKMLLLDCFLVN
jgi:hypothetical protein